ncbi:hypothetical protein AS593_08735 [Caulobacter vibrioides]|nr:hypothetical protein AS593_08735 [Caulobacter vibrioides]
MPEYLSKRGATYYFRRVVPDDLRSHFQGRSEWMLSLRTKERKDAERKVRLEAIKYDRLIDDARSIVSSASSHPSRGAQSQQAVTWDPFPSEEHLEHFIEQSQHDIQDSLDYEFNPARQEIAQAVESALANERELQRAMALELAQERRRTKQMPSPSDLGSIVERWAASETQPDAKTVDRMKAVVSWFEERIGHLRASDITPDHVLDFKERLLAETSPSNAKVKLANLRSLLSYAKRVRLITSNPASDVTITVKVKPGEGRREFDLVALSAIFGSPIYTQGARPSGGAGEAAYWLPLLALYTGARLNELGQLRAKDISQATYFDADGQQLTAWVLKIVADAEDGLKVKNTGSERLVPLHPDLVSLGFLAYAGKFSGNMRLFPDLRPDKYGAVTGNWSKWFNRYLREKCGVTDSRLVFHSFRHSFKHYAREREIPKDVHDAITGHRSKDVADSYGPNYPLGPMVRAISRFQVPGLELPRPAAPHP